MIVVFNALVVGLETDSPKERAGTFDMIELFLLFLFTCELSLRVFLVGPYRFFDREHADFWWDMFDISLVMLGILDAITDWLCPAGTHFNNDMIVLRVIRLLRLLRVLRIVRFLKQLYILSYGLAHAMVAVFWASLGMAALLYACAILLVSTLGKQDEHMLEKFGDVPVAMFSLFRLLLWPEIADYRSVTDGRPLLNTFLIGISSFGSFGMMALLTGVISETMLEKSLELQHDESQEKRLSSQEMIDSFQALFDEFCPGYSKLHHEQIRFMLPQVQEIFAAWRVPCTQQDLEDMVMLMDTGGSGGVTKSEFCRSLLHIAENAEDLQPMLALELHMETMKYVKQRVSQFEEGDGDCSIQMRNACHQVTQQERETKELFGHMLAEAVSEVMAEANLGGSNAKQSIPVVEEVSQMRKRVHALQGGVFALGCRVDELSNEVQSEGLHSQMQELAVRRSCMHLETALDSRVSGVEAEVRKVRTAVSEFSAQLREHRVL
eukprot:CAMPEP_0195150870 /NCGR_PEP_ID=MMETSP0448-20130528/179599_1 /TAXON_ID=66468 /ORGANISM="Heterocapsa triquestra, Strain CCMP 448" /LENGTH=492 /DNA_ID=CAMNT_0040189569 /DNA_START=77 /DNA_END=1555 /DNA_ORIENTATION=+